MEVWLGCPFLRYFPLLRRLFDNGWLCLDVSTIFMWCNTEGVDLVDNYTTKPLWYRTRAIGCSQVKHKILRLSLDIQNLLQCLWFTHILPFSGSSEKQFDFMSSIMGSSWFFQMMDVTEMYSILTNHHSYSLTKEWQYFAKYSLHSLFTNFTFIYNYLTVYKFYNLRYRDSTTRK